MLGQRTCLETIDPGLRRHNGLNKTDGLFYQHARRKLDICALIAPCLTVQVYQIIYQLLRLNGQEYEQFDLLLHQAKPIVVKVYQADQGLIYQPLLANLPSPN